MTSEELKKLIKTGENGVVEFKRGRGGVPGDFWPSYSAFANTDGGVIVLGVSDGKRPRNLCQKDIGRRQTADA